MKKSPASSLRTAAPCPQSEGIAKSPVELNTVIARADPSARWKSVGCLYA